MSGYEYAVDHPIPIPGRPSRASGSRRDDRRGNTSARAAFPTVAGSADDRSEDR
ncbi:hypothetical protein [Halobellus rubicundus]|uniref:Uncharacterized protein n=1 Tax=Halobellus rubicundus TaxID=2996466 RepID=A0ABD5MA32_9EURY